jgi:hypothetical protein
MPEWMKTAGIGVNYDVDSMVMQLNRLTAFSPILVGICPPPGSFSCICHVYKKKHIYSAVVSQAPPCCEMVHAFLLFHHPVRAGKRECRAQPTGYIPKSSPTRHASGFYHTQPTSSCDTHTQTHTNTQTHEHIYTPVAGGTDRHTNTNTQTHTQTHKHARMSTTNMVAQTDRHKVTHRRCFPLHSSTLTAHILVVRSPF